MTRVKENDEKPSYSSAKAPIARTETEDGGRESNSEGVRRQTQYIRGWRLHTISFSLLLSLFIVQLEWCITSTAVLSITDDLGGYEQSSWIFTAYLLTFCGLQIIWAKISDIAGRKIVLVASLSIFVIFSGACGAAQSMTQLVMFRWVQGMGGCGVFSLVQITFFELVPAPKWPLYMGLVTGVIAFALIVGPLLGGAITRNGSWRWIFLMNVPAGVIAVSALLWMFPKTLWNEPAATRCLTSLSGALRRLDFVGSLLLLGSCVLLSTGLQKAALGHEWGSSLIMSLLILSAPFIAGFFLWSWYVTTRRTLPEPVFPWRFCQSRIRLGMMVNTYLVGNVMSVCLVQIPQRYITVNGLSSFNAAIRLLAFGAFIPLGSIFAAALIGRLRVPPCFIILLGAVMQIVGTLLLSRVSTSYRLERAPLGYQVLLGTGIGLATAAMVLLVPYVMEQKDLAVGTAAVTQFRFLGGLIGIAIATSISTPYMRSHLASIVGEQTADSMLERMETIDMLSGEVANEARAVVGRGYNLQIRLLVGFAVAQVPVTGLMWTNVKANPEVK
ncbi:major facilitator superfamily domain-containing protein [Lophiotrema nucula]|uniref:Major facilitator superfamily domain-containing protein n=1 Tax=Lophiotrema nucula TaxID=690887 RepID=A0A6A5YPR6_9PLEO|nr:major facilitator superfamily domain-containing protein [Lophiotrema nucula]